jgi:hypothetical protein
MASRPDLVLVVRHAFAYEQQHLLQCPCTAAHCASISNRPAGYDNPVMVHLAQVIDRKYEQARYEWTMCASLPSAGEVQM